MAPAHDQWRLAVDVGGTFIDYIAFNETSGEVVIDKQPAKADSLADQFIEGLTRLPLQLPELEHFIHGTTVALNTLVQERGVLTGLLTTAGFRDVLELGRGGRRQIFNPRYQPVPPLVERRFRREVPERLDAAGEVLIEIDIEAAMREVDFLVGEGVEAIAVCFLHSYVNGVHEQRIGEAIAERYPHISVSLSSGIVREWREFERTSTTVANAYTQPRFSAYADEIAERVREAGYEETIAFMRSNGGVMPIETAARRPVDTLGSGPAGGVIGAHALIRQTGHRNVVCADVGGTTYDVALIQDGEIVERAETEIAGRKVMGSVIDIVSVGAGGGSIAVIDEITGSLRVGPESAGAQPGPAAFGAGGEDPTVTDAQVILGYLDADNYLGGRMKLDRALAEAAIKRALGAHGEIDEMASGVLAVAQANMANAIRQITTQRGLDVRDFAMVSFGGGGGLFAAGVADELGIAEILVPENAAGFSAWGMLAADYREDTTLTAVTSVDPAGFERIERCFSELSTSAETELATYGFEPPFKTVRSADVRFIGQEHTIRVEIDEEWIETGAERFAQQVKASFVEQHRQLYGHASESDPIEIVTFRCSAVAPVQKPRNIDRRPASDAQVLRSRRIRFLESGWVDEVPVYERSMLARGQLVHGPAVIDEWTTTVIVPPSWSARVDEVSNLVLEKLEK